MPNNSPLPPLLECDLDHIASTVGNSFRALDNKKLLITGASGFIGSWMLESVICAKRKLRISVEIVVVTRSVDGFLERFPHFKGVEGLEIIECDIRDFKYGGSNFDFAVHAAAVYPGPETRLPDSEIIDIQTTGTQKIIEAACDTAHFLYISSGAVYDRRSQCSPIKENSCLLNPTSQTAYANGKIEAEKLILATQELKRNSTYTIARCFSFIGPRLDVVRAYASSDFIHAIQQERQIKIRTDGKAMRSFMYAADLSVALWNILFSGKPGEIYNVGCSEEFSIADLAQKISLTLLPDAKIIARNEIITEGDYYVPDSTKVSRELNFKNLISLEEAIKKTANYYKKCVQ